MATALLDNPGPRTTAPDPPAPIVLDHLSHDYGGRVALNGLSFTVEAGTIFGLLGPNGSGKTTLFRILSTLMIPSGGHAAIAGFDVVRQASQVRRHTGIVFQARSLDAKLTVAENLRHAGHLYGWSGSSLQARIADVLERVALTDRARDLVETLSGGMQRRVELAKGLIHNPSVLLLDEPTTGLDPGSRRDLWQYLEQLRDQQGVTVLVTTHLMEEAGHCDRLAILHQGALVGLGSPAALKAEIGGDVIQLETADDASAQALALRIGSRFQTLAQAVGHTVRIERGDGHRFVADVVEAFPGQIESVTVSRPSLEDVFIQRTGHRFWNEKTQAELDADTLQNKKKRKH